MSSLRSFVIAAVLLAGTAAAQTITPDSSDPGFLQLKYVTVVVRNYDEALKWYTDVLGWHKTEDRTFGPGQRWIVVAPPGQSGLGIVLDLPTSGGAADGMRDYSDRVGKETNWVFQVADCAKLYETLSRRGVKFLSPPRKQPWGTSQAVFEDLYGNVFVVESAAAAR